MPTVLIRLALRVVVLALIIAAVVAIVPGLHVHGGFGTYLWIAVIFSVVNLFLGTVLRLLTLPLIILSLGLFLLVVNAIVLSATAGLSRSLDIDGFGSAVLGGFLIALFSWVAELVVPLSGPRSVDRRRDSVDGRR